MNLQSWNRWVFLGLTTDTLLQATRPSLIRLRPVSNWQCQWHATDSCKTKRQSMGKVADEMMAALRGMYIFVLFVWTSHLLDHTTASHKSIKGSRSTTLKGNKLVDQLRLIRLDLHLNRFGHARFPPSIDEMLKRRKNGENKGLMNKC